MSEFEKITKDEFDQSRGKRFGVPSQLGIAVRSLTVGNGLQIPCVHTKKNTRCKQLLSLGMMGYGAFGKGHTSVAHTKDGKHVMILRLK